VQKCIDNKIIIIELTLQLI